MICRYRNCINSVPSAKHKYCSDECRAKVADERNKETTARRSKENTARRAKVKKIPCVECGNLFKPIKKAQIRCSEKCRVIGRKKREKLQRVCNCVGNGNYKKYLKRGEITYAGYGSLK